MGAQAKAVRLKEETVRFLRGRAGTCREPDGVGCWMCARILDSILPDGTLREWPHDQPDEALKYPVSAQRTHVLLEQGKPAA